MPRRIHVELMVVGSSLGRTQAIDGRSAAAVGSVLGAGTDGSRWGRKGARLESVGGCLRLVFDEAVEVSLVGLRVHSRTASTALEGPVEFTGPSRVVMRYADRIVAEDS